MDNTTPRRSAFHPMHAARLENNTPHLFNNAANAWGECLECGLRLTAKIHADAPADGQPEWVRRSKARSLVAADWSGRQRVF